MSNDVRDSVETDVAGAIAELRGEVAPAPVVDPAAANALTEDLEEALTEAAGEPKPIDVKLDKHGNLHGEKGRFAPKTKAEEPAESANKLIASPDPAKELADKDVKPLQPPKHWDAQAKAEFMQAPRALQQQALKREEEIEKARAEWGGKAEDYNRLDKVISPHRDRWARQGRSPDAAINQLVAMERAVESNPIAGVAEILRVFARGNEMQVIDQIARANGYMLAQANNQGQPPQGQQPAQADPAVSRLHEQVQYLTNTLSQREQAEQQQYRQSILSEVNAFAAEPEHLYYENVKPLIARLVTEGDENGDTRPIRVRLQEAYDKAVWADPTTRQLLIAEQQRKAQAEQSRKAAAARHAGGSVTGSPGAGRPEPSGRQSQRSNSIEDDVRAALLETRA